LSGEDGQGECLRAIAPPARQASSSYILRPITFASACMEWRIIGLNFLYAAVGVVLMFVSYRVIDRLTPEVDFPAELKKGNVAVAIFIAALFLAIAIIVGQALH
jgi:putative membrane protein